MNELQEDIYSFLEQTVNADVADTVVEMLKEHETQLTEQKKLMKKALNILLHDMACPLSYYRNMIYILERCMKKDPNDPKIKEILEGFVKNLDMLCEFRKLAIKLLYPKYPPDKDELEEIIKEMNNVL